MDLLIKIAAVCVPAALIASVLKKDSPAMSILIALAAVCVVTFSALGALGEIRTFLTEIADASGVSPTVLRILLKVVGIALISRLSADLCRDAGLSAAASASDLAGAAAALYTSLPLLRGVFRIIKNLL